jgi:peptidoglycan/xylan/chitin deacetylase (PgdA/CDA1 family)
VKRLGILLAGCVLFSFLFSSIGYAQGKRDVYYRAAQSTTKIALTFDDGPHPRYTDEILSILGDEGVKATFFTIGCNVKQYPEIVKRVMAAGHEIGNHTYTHPLVPLVSSQMIEDEIKMTDTVLLSLGCACPTFFRPPQGKFPPDKEGLLQRTGKIAVLWSIDTRDWEHKPTEEIVRMVENEVAGGDIILFHDFVGGESQTIPAIKKLIPTLKERGYQFVTLSELLLDE